MAIGDILEGLLAGAAGGFRGYSEASRLQREEEERERVRREAAAERRRAERISLASAGYTPATREEIAGAEIAATAPELARVLEEIGSTMPPAPMAIPEPEIVSVPRERRAMPETRDGRIRGTGAGVAPGQTYSAVQKALMESEEPPVARPDRLATVMERGPAPAPVRGPSARERGLEVLDLGEGEAYTRPSEQLLEDREIARKERERKLTAERAADLFARGMQGDEEALAQISAENLGADFRTFRQIVEPVMEEPDLVTTAEGYSRWDPETGTFVPVVGPEGRRLMPQRGSEPRPPSLQRMTDDKGNIWSFNPETGKVNPVIGPDGQQMKAPERSDLLEQLFLLGSMSGAGPVNDEDESMRGRYERK